MSTIDEDGIASYATFKDRLAAVAAAVPGWPDPDDWTVAERDQIIAMAKEEDSRVDLFPVVHAWRTRYHGGSQLTFWCRYCKDHHVHGRHSGPGRYVDPDDNVVQVRTTPEGLIRRIPGMARLWKAYVRRFETCRYNPDVPGGRGICTCPMGSGDGHRVAHCWKEDSPYFRHGYILHEVEPEDPRAFTKPKRARRLNT